MWKNLVGALLCISPLLSSIHGSGSYLTLPEENSHYHYHLATNSATFNSDLFIRYIGNSSNTSVFQETTTWLDSRPTPLGRTHT